MDSSQKLLVENVQLGFGVWGLGFWDGDEAQIVTDSKFIGLNLWWMMIIIGLGLCRTTHVAVTGIKGFAGQKCCFQLQNFAQ